MHPDRFFPSPPPAISRCEFLVASSSAVLAGTLPNSTAAQSSATTKLAVHGGEKTVRQPVPLPIRWGEPERERLSAMLGQDSLFYWKGPQTTLLIERFNKVVMPSSSGTAALHIAVAAAGTVSGTIQDQELLFDQNRFGDHRTRAAGTCESGDRRNEMDEKHNYITHDRAS